MRALPQADSIPPDFAPTSGRPTPRLLWAGAGLLLAALAFAALSQSAAAADGDVTVVANMTPLQPTEGEVVTINYTITNNLQTAQQNIVLKIQQGTQQWASRPGINIPANGNFSAAITFTAQTPSVVNAGAPLRVQVETVIGQPLGHTEFPFYNVKPRVVPPPELPIIPIVAVVAVGGGLGALLFIRNKRKAEEARLRAEAAAKKELEKRAAAEAARELAATQKVHGKYPAEYFYRRRLRLAVLVPSGMTSAGLNVLRVKVIEEKKVVYSCPRCGTHKESYEAPCPRCTVVDAIEAMKGEVKKHRQSGDMTDVNDLLQQADFQMSYSSFGEAWVLVDQAKTLFNEILTGSERTVKVKKIETISASDRKATVLDLGLQGEHTQVDAAHEEHEHETREAYASAAAACPTCGHAMYGDLCAYCHFDDYARLVEDAIAAGAKGGAETVEPRDLLERARKMREEDNKSTASRYLNRARFVATAALQAHQASRAEGMIDYARTLMLVGEEDGLNADFASAEATLGEADAKKLAGDVAGAVQLAERAENEIHAALQDLTKRVAIKRIDEVAAMVDEAQKKGTNVAAPEAKLKDARAAFDSGDFEKARDVSGEAKKILVDATKGKTVCPKCGKPVQPTWARCPFCTTQLIG